MRYTCEARYYYAEGCAVGEEYLGGLGGAGIVIFVLSVGMTGWRFLFGWDCVEEGGEENSRSRLKVLGSGSPLRCYNRS